MATTIAVRELTDPELIGAARKGDVEAYGELYRRHNPSALAAARALTRSRSDADDVASEAFARVLRALQSGGGPDVSFRPYLVTVVRNVFYDRVRRNREEPSADMSDEVNTALLDAARDQEDGAFAAAAFATLPERWQLVLWHTEVEGRSVSEVAPLLGLAPNAVAALAYRAREGLRQAYLQAHLRDQHAAECRDTAGNLGAYVRDGLSARDRRHVDDHLDKCASCTALVAELTDTNNTLRAALIPILVGVSASAYLDGLGGSGMLGRFARLPKGTQVAVGGGSAAASVVTLALLIGSLGGGATPSAAPPVGPRVTAAPTSAVPPPSSAEQPPVVVTTVATLPPPAPPATTLPATAPPETASPEEPRTTLPRSTVPRSTLPATTVPAATTTTLPLAPASLTASAVQRTVALANGQVRIELTVTNVGGTAANTVRIEVPAPPGAAFAFAESFRVPAVNFVSAIANGWTCTGNVSCDLPTLPPGGSTTAQLTFDISPSAPSNITLTPVIAEPVGVAVSITPVTIPVSFVDGLLAGYTARGDVQAIGNSVTTCKDISPNCVDARNGVGPALDHNDHLMKYVNTAGGAFNSSTAQLTLRGTVARAFLVWSGDTDQSGFAPDPSQRGTVTFQVPGGSHTVVADSLVDIPGGTYHAVAEVTTLVAGGGTYGVADVQTALGVSGFGGWSLVLIEHDSSMPERLLMVAAPFAVFDAGVPFSFEVALLAPLDGGRATLAGAAFECDRNLAGETLTLSGVAVPNFFRCTAPTGRNPGDDNLLGTDVYSGSFTGLSGQQLSFDITSTDERVMLSVIAVALDM